jgi:hypothetical protein
MGWDGCSDGSAAISRVMAPIVAGSLKIFNMGAEWRLGLLVSGVP